MRAENEEERKQGKRGDERVRRNGEQRQVIRIGMESSKRAGKQGERRERTGE